jgi:hypothetical protein
VPEPGVSARETAREKYRPLQTFDLQELARKKAAPRPEELPHREREGAGDLRPPPEPKRVSPPG